jgi:hypothetical protein
MKNYNWWTKTTPLLKKFDTFKVSRKWKFFNENFIWWLHIIAYQLFLDSSHAFTTSVKFTRNVNNKRIPFVHLFHDILQSASKIHSTSSYLYHVRTLYSVAHMWVYITANSDIFCLCSKWLVSGLIQQYVCPQNTVACKYNCTALSAEELHLWKMSYTKAMG